MKALRFLWQIVKWIGQAVFALLIIGTILWLSQGNDMCGEYPYGDSVPCKDLDVREI